jgi:hypothetical protein
MNYEIVTHDFMAATQEHVVITYDDGSFESFPVDENNSRYQQFLSEQETA